MNVRIKDGLQLRKIGHRYMVVDVCSENVNMSTVYSLNATAADLWKLLEQGHSSLEELADWLCAQYEIDRATALQDVTKQLDEWKNFGLIRG